MLDAAIASLPDLFLPMDRAHLDARVRHVDREMERALDEGRFDDAANLAWLQSWLLDRLMA